MSTERVFKIFWKNEVRRFSSPLISWNSFQEQLRAILGEDFHPELQVQYVDDEGDRVELATQYEWEACLGQVPAGGMVKLYIKPHDHGIYFKDSPKPRVKACHFMGPDGSKADLDLKSPEALSLTSVPNILASFFPDGKILPRNLPDWMGDTVVIKNQGPHDVELDISVQRLIDALFKHALNTMQTDVNKADELWAKTLALALPLYRNSLNSTLTYVYYNIACTKSILNNKAEAIENLRKAIETGYNNFQHAEKDSDLDNIRQEPEYAVLITEKLMKPEPVKEEAPVEEKMESLAIKEEESMEVEEQPKSEPEAPFAKELTTLKTMGFTQDDNTLIVLLAAYNGDVNGVIGHLFSA